MYVNCQGQLERKIVKANALGKYENLPYNVECLIKVTYRYQRGHQTSVCLTLLIYFPFTIQIFEDY